MRLLDVLVGEILFMSSSRVGGQRLSCPVRGGRSGQDAEFEDRSGAGDVEAVADQVAADALDRAGGDRPARCTGCVVAELFEVAGQAADAGVDGLAPGSGRAGRHSVR